MLELAILGLLKEQDLHGYELKKRLTEALGFVRSVSFGSLYPALGRLERAGAVRTVVATGVSSVPQTGSIGGELAAFRARAGRARSGRSRKVYGITPAGEQLFDELLVGEGTNTGEDGRVFHLRLAFARYLPADARIGLLERRRAQLLERLGGGATRARTRPGDRYLDSLIEHDREATQHDLSWIERLIAGERAAPGPEPTPLTHGRGAVARIDSAPEAGHGGDGALAAPTLTAFGRGRPESRATTGLTTPSPAAVAAAGVRTIEPGRTALTEPGPPVRTTKEESKR